MTVRSHHATDAADAVALAKATVVGFDDIDMGFGIAEVPSGYAGLDWANFYAVDPTKTSFSTNSGFYAGITSGTQDAFGFNAPSTVSIAKGSFTLDSVELTAAWDKALTVEVTGYKNGVELYDVTVKLTDKAATLVDLGFKGVDEVEFVALGGKADPKVNGSGDLIVYDDFSFARIKGGASAVPSHGHIDTGHLPPHADLHHAPLALA